MRADSSRIRKGLVPSASLAGLVQGSDISERSLDNVQIPPSWDPRNRCWCTRRATLTKRDAKVVTRNTQRLSLERSVEPFWHGPIFAGCAKPHHSRHDPT